MRKVTAIMVAVVFVLNLMGCGKTTNNMEVVNEGETQTFETLCTDLMVKEEGCGCSCGCEACVCAESNAMMTETVMVNDVTNEEQESSEAVTQSADDYELETQSSIVDSQDTTSSVNDESEKTVQNLTEGEKAARRTQQANFAQARETLYSLPNSKDKTAKINQMDRQILANNSYDFSQENIVFIGDSITEGITSAIDQNGNFISYVTYADSYLNFNRTLNHGVGGRMYSTYGGEELSLAMNFGNVTNVDSDIIVVFAGVNDFLCSPETKRFGNPEDKMSTAGYCGSLRYFMKQLKEYYSDREIFFVTMYNVSKNSECSYSDYNGQPTLKDYMDVQRELVEEYGFHLIDLYDTGFMDCTNKDSADYYLRDGLHPKDNGCIVLGEHIAAELSLYFSQKK